MHNNIEHYFKEEPESPILLRFLLNNNDTITIGGNSVAHVFFEFSSKFPEKFPCKAIGFSGETKEESESYLKEFFSLVNKYSHE